MAGSAGFFSPENFRFLYREDVGRIDVAKWRGGAMALAAAFVVTTALMLWALPYANRPLTERAFYDPATLAANVYILAYATLTVFVGISWVNLSAKRFRDRGRPAPLGLAGLLPLAMLAAGAAHWLQPRVSEVMPRCGVWGCDVILIVVAVWTLLELFDAIRGSRAQ